MEVVVVVHISGGDCAATATAEQSFWNPRRDGDGYGAVRSCSLNNYYTVSSQWDTTFKDVVPFAEHAITPRYEVGRRHCLRSVPNCNTFTLLGCVADLTTAAAAALEHFNNENNNDVFERGSLSHNVILFKPPPPSSLGGIQIHKHTHARGALTFERHTHYQ